MSHRAHETHLDEDGEEDDFEDNEDEEDPDTEDQEEDAEDEGDEEDYDDDLPQELRDGVAAAEAFFTRAKKMRAEVEKARGFFKKGGSDGADKDEKIKQMKAKLSLVDFHTLGEFEKRSPSSTPGWGGSGGGREPWKICPG